MVRTDNVPVPAMSVTPDADQVVPLGFAETQVVPPSALTWIVSPVPSVPVKVPLTVCEPVLVTKSLFEEPVSELSAVAVATAVGAVASSV